MEPTLESFFHEKDYAFWGLYSPKHGLIYPSLDHKNSPRVFYHEVLLKQKFGINIDDAFSKGWLIIKVFFLGRLNYHGTEGYPKEDDLVLSLTFNAIYAYRAARFFQNYELIFFEAMNDKELQKTFPYFHPYRIRKYWIEVNDNYIYNYVHPTDSLKNIINVCKKIAAGEQP